MLYDKRWDAKFEQRVDPLSLRGLVQWLEKQPASTEYRYADPFSCLHTQWRLAAGATDYLVSAGGLEHRYGKGSSGIFSDHPQTFGAALDRARSFIGDK